LSWSKKDASTPAGGEVLADLLVIDQRADRAIAEVDLGGDGSHGRHRPFGWVKRLAARRSR
jgi:hypothetical protein